MSAPYYRSLDGLRAIAVGIVLLAHAGMPGLRSGAVGVDVFFVLSGFLITSILVEESRRDRIRFGNFYIRRALRLVPCLVFACLLVLGVGWMLEGELPLIPVAAALTYTTNWVRALSDIDMQSLAHCWSLAIEEQYYLIWPLTILGLERLSRNDRASAGILTLLALGVAFYRYSMVGIYSPDRIYYGLDTHIDGIILGSALAYAVRHVRLSGGLSSSKRRLLSWVATPLALAALAYAVLVMKWWLPPMAQYGFLMVAVASTVVIAHMKLGGQSPLSWLCERRPMVYIGRISYGLYLLHYPVYVTTNELAEGANPYLRALIKLSVSFALAMLSYHFLETPFLKLKKFFVGKSVVSRGTAWGGENPVKPVVSPEAVVASSGRS